MKLTKHFLTALALAALTAGAWAQTETASNAVPPAPSPAAAATPASPAATLADIEELKAALAAQQRQIQALQAQLQTKNEALAQVQPSPSVAQPEVAPPANGAPSNVPTTVAANVQDAPADKPQQNAGSSDERIRNLERQIKGIGPISFSGDIRLRAEPFFGGPSDESLERARARVRARFNAIATLGEQFRAGLTLASGDINDPTTTNQTLTGFYTRKAVALDQAFVEFTPRAFKPLTLVGGKFRYPWYNTELTWDKDLNPEGAG